MKWRKGWRWDAPGYPGHDGAYPFSFGKDVNDFPLFPAGKSSGKGDTRSVLSECCGVPKACSAAPRVLADR